MSRGAAFGDVNNDGAVDIVVIDNNAPARLLLNEAGKGRHWLLVKLEASKRNRFALGAEVGLFRRGENPMWRRAHTDGSYLSASDVRVHFGLGNKPAIEALVVRWPDGKGERWEEVHADQIITVRQGTGKPA